VIGWDRITLSYLLSSQPHTLPPYQFFFFFFFLLFLLFFLLLCSTRTHTQRPSKRGLRAESEIERKRDWEIEREPDPERRVAREGKNRRAREPGEADPPWVIADEAKAKDFRWPEQPQTRERRPVTHATHELKPVRPATQNPWSAEPDGLKAGIPSARIHFWWLGSDFRWMEAVLQWFPSVVDYPKPPEPKTYDPWPAEPCGKPGPSGAIFRRPSEGCPTISKGFSMEFLG